MYSFFEPQNLFLESYSLDDARKIPAVTAGQDDKQTVPGRDIDSRDERLDVVPRDHARRVCISTDPFR